MSQSGRLVRVHPPTPVPLGPRCRASCGRLLRLIGSSTELLLFSLAHRGRRFVGFFHNAGSTRPQLESIALLVDGFVDMLRPRAGLASVPAVQTGPCRVRPGTKPSGRPPPRSWVCVSDAQAALKTRTKSYWTALHLANVQGMVNSDLSSPSTACHGRPWPRHCPEYQCQGTARNILRQQRTLP